MALLGKGNKNTNKSAAKRGSILEKVGLKTEKVATPDDQVRDERHRNIRLAWVYLRDRIDKAIDNYYRTGSLDSLEEFVERPALDSLKDLLHQLSADNIVWEQPDRNAITEPQYKIVDETLNKNNQPTRFVIEERFKDYSTHRQVNNEGHTVLDARCPGTERVIQATVNVRDGTEFKLHSVIEVRHAVLDQ